MLYWFKFGVVYILVNACSEDEKAINAEGKSLNVIL